MREEKQEIVAVTLRDVRLILLAAAGLLAASVFISMGIGYLIGSGHLKLW